MISFYVWPTPDELAHRRWMSTGSAQILLNAIEELYGKDHDGLACLNFTVDITVVGGKAFERLAQYKLMVPVKLTKED